MICHISRMIKLIPVVYHQNVQFLYSLHMSTNQMVINFYKLSFDLLFFSTFLFFRGDTIVWLINDRFRAELFLTFRAFDFRIVLFLSFFLCALFCGNCQFIIIINLFACRSERFCRSRIIIIIIMNGWMDGWHVRGYVHTFVRCFQKWMPYSKRSNAFNGNSGAPLLEVLRRCGSLHLLLFLLIPIPAWSASSSSASSIPALFLLIGSLSSRLLSCLLACLFASASQECQSERSIKEQQSFLDQW